MARLRIGQRARLTLVSALTSGVLLFGVFAAVVFAGARAEQLSVRNQLDRALRQCRSEVESNPTDPDLAEVANADPSLSLATFNSLGNSVVHVGQMRLTSGLSDGIGRLQNGALVMALSQPVGSIRIVAAEPWAPHDEAMRRLAILLTMLWAPLTGLATLAAWLAARATFRPLNDLASQAEHLSDQSLSKRLTVQSRDEYAEFAERLNRFLDRIEDSVRRQQQFVADAAHELRTPLAVLRGRIETTLRRSRSAEEYRNALETALHEAERLSTLVEALLQTARPSGEPIGRTDVEISAERAHARWVDRFTDRNVLLSLEAESVEVAAREAEIEVLLDNLLSNALRASPKGSQCRLSVARNAERCILAVEDEGAGVPLEMAEQIFERFARGDEGRSRDDGGFGIGLAVCRRLATARGGAIRAENGAIGARFVIEFPAIWR